ncbi:hypothetical protein MRX96_026841 [Rhipicephalus microplus]
MASVFRRAMKHSLLSSCSAFAAPPWRTQVHKELRGRSGFRTDRDLVVWKGAQGGVDATSTRGCLPGLWNT